MRVEKHLPELKAGIWRHWKGHLYLVLGYAADSNIEDRTVVVYLGLDLEGAKSGERMFTRTVEDFFAMVDPYTGLKADKLAPVGPTPVDRFTFVGPTVPGLPGKVATPAERHGDDQRMRAALIAIVRQSQPIRGSDLYRRASSEMKQMTPFAMEALLTLIAEGRLIRDTQFDMITLPGYSTPLGVYYCPRSGELETAVGGGFGTCCDRPDLHAPMAAAKLIEHPFVPGAPGTDSCAETVYGADVVDGAGYTCNRAARSHHLKAAR